MATAPSASAPPAPSLVDPLVGGAMHQAIATTLRMGAACTGAQAALLVVPRGAGLRLLGAPSGAPRRTGRQHRVAGAVLDDAASGRGAAVLVHADGEPFAEAPGATAALGTPVTIGDRVAGVLCLYGEAAALQAARDGAQAAGVAGVLGGLLGGLESRREARRAVRVARDGLARAEALAEALPGGLFQIDVAPGRPPRMGLYSARFAALFGLEPDGIDADARNVLDQLEPADLEAMTATCQAAAPHQVVHQRLRLRAPDGERWLELSATSQPRPGGVVRWHGFASDITGRMADEADARRRDQQLADVIETAMDAIVTLDAQHRIVIFNGAAERTFGVTRAEALGDRIERFLPASLHAAHRRHVERFAQTGATVRRMGGSQPLKALRADGSEFPIEASISRSADGTLVTVVLRDITDRLRAEQARHAQAMAEESSRAKSEFVARMGHEIRAPLNAIVGFSDLLDLSGDTPLSPAQREHVAHVRSATAHLTALVEDVLDISRLESGTLPALRVPIEPQPAIEQAVRETALLGAQRGVQVIVVPWARGTPPRIEGDPTRLRQVLLNLLSNAVKYNRPGGRVEVRTERRGMHLRIGVTDTGIGMEPWQLERLFRPFDRLGREDSGVPGTGIGLVIARSLVQSMGGELCVTSTPGVGTSFTVLMRVIDAAVAPPPVAPAPAVAAAHPAQPAHPAHPAHRGRRVLHIDDDDVTRTLLKAIAALRAGVELHSAPDLAGALAIAARHPPDLVVSDLNLPDGTADGLPDGLAHALGRLPPPCLLLTGETHPDRIAAALGAGFVGYLTKPASAAALLAEFDRRLGTAPAEAATSGSPGVGVPAAAPTIPAIPAAD